MKEPHAGASSPGAAADNFPATDGKKQLKRMAPMVEYWVSGTYGSHDHEGQDTSEVRESRGPLRLRQHVRDAQHRRFDPRGNLLDVPPVLHRQAEVHGYRRGGRAVPEKVRHILYEEGQRPAEAAIDTQARWKPAPALVPTGAGVFYLLMNHE